ncbi:MAG: hypothetical protein CSA49_02960 [Gammaproteobacteria bacterium]|nr:MAG: hypothetical protein CSA49_02960 [Gammaproteobacteria bacterium]
MAEDDQYSTQRNAANRCRFDINSKKGHYESYFLRANHPEKPYAFWIRYTVFVPKGKPENSIGELWAIFFNGETHQVTAVKEELPLAQCAFSSEGLSVNMGDRARLVPGKAQGAAALNGHQISWQLHYGNGEKPLLLLPEVLYSTPLPKAKALVGNPNVRYRGSLVVDGNSIAIDNWQGSENHNWGEKHTDYYAWGQVAGFDNDPQAFLEVATARLKIGPIWTPWMTTLVIRVDGEEIKLNNLWNATRAKATFNYFNWHIETAQGDTSVVCDIYGLRYDFVGLNYYNPPGGTNICLNSKIAGCRLQIKRQGKPQRVLETRNRAAFEILTADRSHGVKVVA